jgi:hypothetical protein
MRKVITTVLFVAGLLAAGLVMADSDIEWQQIREEESRIVFRAPGLEEGIKRFYIGLDRCATRYMGRWVGPSGFSPTAYVLVNSHFARCVLSFEQMRRSLKDDLRDMNIPEGSRVIFDNEETSDNALGRVTFLQFSVNSTECVAFKQHWRSPFRGSLWGSYCVDAGEALSRNTILEVLQGIGVK